MSQSKLHRHHPPLQSHTTTKNFPSPKDGLVEFRLSPAFRSNLKQCAALQLLSSRLTSSNSGPISNFSWRASDSPEAVKLRHLQVFTMFSLCKWHSNLNRDLSRNRSSRVASVLALLFSAMPCGTPVLYPALGVRFEHMRMHGSPC